MGKGNTKKKNIEKRYKWTYIRGKHEKIKYKEKTYREKRFYKEKTIQKRNIYNVDQGNLEYTIIQN